MTAALYIRVSTAEQNAELQRRELRAYAARRGLEITEEFSDVASGADRTRPALRRLLEQCAAGFVECVLVWKLDRFGRSLIDCLNNLDLLERERVRFVAVQDNLEVERNNPTSKLIVHVLGAAAEFERAVIQERTRAGVRRYRQDYAAGRVGRNVHSHSGKDLPPHRPRAVFDRAKIEKLRSEGLSYGQIAQRLNVSRSTIFRTRKVSP